MFPDPLPKLKFIAETKTESKEEKVASVEESKKAQKVGPTIKTEDDAIDQISQSQPQLEGGIEFSNLVRGGKLSFDVKEAERR